MRVRRRRRRLALALLLAAAARGVQVRTTVGTVRGAIDGDLAVFAGIPYALPPVGARRFLPPTPLPPAERGAPPLDVTAFRPDCMQTSVGNALAPVVQAEDCLYLNIWAPARGAGARASASWSSSSLRGQLAAAELRPVLVWIHGGAFRSGGTSMPCYNGSALARRADAIVVSVNYRLGPFGFLVSAADGLAGNAGLADQRLALRWVAENARAFGGDARAVTLFGESAGAMSVGLHLTDPAARGLFRAAAIMSAPLAYRYRTIALADKLSRAFLERLGCTGARALACAQGEPARTLLAAADTLVGLPRHVSDLLWWAPVAPVHWGAAARARGSAGGVEEGAGGADGGDGDGDGDGDGGGSGSMAAHVRQLGPRRGMSLLEAIGGSHAELARASLVATPSLARARAPPRAPPVTRPVTPPVTLPPVVPPRAPVDAARGPPSTRRARLGRLLARTSRAAGRALVGAAARAALARVARAPGDDDGDASRAGSAGPGAVASFADVPLLVGSTADEASFFLALAGVGARRMSRPVLRAAVTFLFRFAARRVLRVYAPEVERGAGAGAGEAVDCLPVFAAILTDYMFRCPARRLAAALHAAPRVSPTFAYRFVQRSNHTPVEACRGLACHTMELPFLFEQPEPPLAFSRDEAALARAMAAAWASFAWTGAPGAVGRGAGAAGAAWPRWTVGGDETLELRWPPHLSGGPDAPACDAVCDFWDSTGYAF